MWAITINGGFGFVMMITFAFTMGDPGIILETATGYPFIQAFYNATNSHVGTSIMVAVIIVNVTSSCISTLATVSRQLWSFARDGGLPFSGFIEQVRRLDPVPAGFLTNCFSDQTRLEYPLERRHGDIPLYDPPLPHQHWLDRRF